jgi:hypothetical protein
MMDHAYNPAVSYILFPINDYEQELFLNASEDYSMGKLVRSGLDAVYGIDPAAGKKIYDASDVRKNLRKIEDHLEVFKQNFPGKKEIVLQGNGNLGLNNWSVGFINQTSSKQFIIPTGEPIHERIYPSFIKTGTGNNVHYEVSDIMYFYDNKNNDKKLVDLKDVKNRIIGNPDSLNYS